MKKTGVDRVWGAGPAAEVGSPTTERSRRAIDPQRRAARLQR
jgi:hypothetical protein